MTTKDINITNIDVLKLRQQRVTLSAIFELFSMGIVNANCSTSQEGIDAMEKDILDLMMMLDKMMYTANAKDFVKDHLQMINIDANNP